MKNILLAVFILASTVFLSSCVSSEARKNRKNLDLVKPGMTKEEVIKIMGEPDKTQVYYKPDLWWYFTQSKWSDGMVTRDECTPLVFKDGVLVGKGFDYYKLNYSLKDWDTKTLKEVGGFE